MARFILSSFADEAASDLDSQIRISGENGVRRIEMRGVDGKNISQITPAEARRIREKLDLAGFRLSAVGSAFGKISITDDFAPHLEQFGRCIETARTLGAPYIRLFSFYTPEGADPGVYRDEVFERLSRFVQAAEGSGIVCCHENEKGIYGNSPERCLDICRTFGRKLPAVFDPANFIQESYKPLAAYELLEPYTEYLHIKDARLADGGVTPAGKGDGELPEILRRFSAKQGDRFLTVEPHLAIFDGYSSLEQTPSSIGGQKFLYRSNEEAYGVAVGSLKEILTRLGYQEEYLEGESVWKK